MPAFGGQPPSAHRGADSGQGRVPRNITVPLFNGAETVLIDFMRLFGYYSPVSIYCWPVNRRVPVGKVTRALISVSHKEGVLDFARGIEKLGIEILSTGGTAKLLRDGGVKVKDVSEFTGFPEMLDGRVKTLHPKVHGGLLGRRNNPEHMKAWKEHNIEPIDLVVVNLYPFEQTVAKPGCTLDDAIENIDIGGPTMLRSAAKNYTDVAVVVSPRDYDRVLDELQKTGEVSLKTRFELCRTVFLHTARYDSAISAWLDSQVPADENSTRCASRVDQG